MGKLSILAAITIMALLANCTPPLPDRPTVNLEKAPQSVTLLGEGLISTSAYERDFAISPDGNEIFFSVAIPDQSMRGIARILKDGEGWTAPETAPFSGRYDDIEATFSPDGQKLFFASNRPLNNTDETDDFNIWMCQRTASGWSEPVSLDTLINSPGQEYYPSVAANGNLYFTASRDDSKGQEDIYVSIYDGKSYAIPVSLDSAINTAYFEFNAFVAPDESYLVFASFGRPDGLGGGDLYISHKNAGGVWQPAKHLGPDVNSSKLDFCPYVDIERGIFYFTSDRAGQEERDTSISYDQMQRVSNSALNGLGNIYHVTADILK